MDPFEFLTGLGRDQHDMRAFDYSHHRLLQGLLVVAVILMAINDIHAAQVVILLFHACIGSPLYGFRIS